jgi:hypothetical protein
LLPPETRGGESTEKVSELVVLKPSSHTTKRGAETDPKIKRFEYLWEHSFRSQIEILELLRDRGPTQKEELRRFFKPILQQQGYTFEMFLQFLLGYNLATLLGEDSNHLEIAITAFGEEFLAFLRDHRYDKNLKPAL